MLKILGHLKPLIFCLSHMENQWFLGVPMSNILRYEVPSCYEIELELLDLSLQPITCTFFLQYNLLSDEIK